MKLGLWEIAGIGGLIWYFTRPDEDKEQPKKIKVGPQKDSSAPSPPSLPPPSGGFPEMPPWIRQQGQPGDVQEFPSDWSRIPSGPGERELFDVLEEIDKGNGKNGSIIEEFFEVVEEDSDQLVRPLGSQTPAWEEGDTAILREERHLAIDTTARPPQGYEWQNGRIVKIGDS